jgi:hypothetical protein
MKNKSKKPAKQKNRKQKLAKALLLIGGSFSLALGTIGIFLPILPATLFFLLSAAC